MCSTKADTRQKSLEDGPQSHVPLSWIYILRSISLDLFEATRPKQSSAGNILTIDANSTLQIRKLFSDEN